MRLAEQFSVRVFSPPSVHFPYCVVKHTARVLAAGRKFKWKLCETYCESACSWGGNLSGSSPEEEDSYGGGSDEGVDWDDGGPLPATTTGWILCMSVRRVIKLTLVLPRRKLPMEEDLTRGVMAGVRPPLPSTPTGWILCLSVRRVNMLTLDSIRFKILLWN